MGRAMAPGSKDMPKLKRLSSYAVTAIQKGGPVELIFKGTPGAPISVFTGDGGRWESGLSADTKKADANGIAKFKYYATGGVIADVNIVAAGPRNSGVVKSIVYVKLKDLD